MKRNIRFSGVFMMAMGLVMLSCDGKLSREQRQEMREARKDRAIKRLTDQEIMQGALEAGRMIRQEFESGNASDSLARLYGATILTYTDSAGMEPLVLQLWQAYQEGWKSGREVGENVQRDYPDYLYYTYETHINDSVNAMVTIRMKRKEIIVNQ
jgi:hypothetical protein